METKDLERALQLNTKNDLRRTWRCPGELALAEFVDSDSTRRRSKRIEKHVSNCDFCSHQVALLLHLESHKERPAPRELLARAESLVENTSGGVFPSLNRHWAFSAATVACGIILAALVWLSGPDPLESRQPVDPSSFQTLRNGGKQGSEIELVSPVENAVVASKAVRFEWKPLSDALFYELDVVDLEGNLVWSARIDASETVLPSSVILSSGQYYVVVRAVMKDGRISPGKFTEFSVR